MPPGPTKLLSFLMIFFEVPVAMPQLNQPENEEYTK